MKLPGKGIGWKQFFVGLKNEYKKDRVGDTAGALTFYGVLALFPFLLFAVALASVFIDPGEAQKLVDQLGKVAPGQVTQILGGQIQKLGSGSNPGLLSVGALGALWAASGGLNHLAQALNIAYDVEEGRPFWKLRLTSLVMTLVVGVLSLVAGAVMIGGGAVASHLPGPFNTLVAILRFPVAGLLMMFIWALIYYALPDVEQKFKFISPGSIVGVILWLIASWGFSLYVSNFGKYDATYGALGGVIVMLLWMWISAQVLLLGAEINAVIEHMSPEGKREGAKMQSDTGTAPTPRAAEKRRTEAHRPQPHQPEFPFTAESASKRNGRGRARKKKSMKRYVTGLAAAWAQEKLGRKPHRPVEFP